MITLYFDCFFGVSGEKILGALIDCVGMYDLEDALCKVSEDCATIRCAKTLIGGIPGTKAEIISADNDTVMDEFLLGECPDDMTKLAKEMFVMTGGETKKEFYTLFCVLYLLSKTDHDRVITSFVYDGMGDGTEGNIPDINVISVLESRGIKVVITDSPCFVSTLSGAAVLSSVAEECGSMPDGDIVKIGYGLGNEITGVSDALRLVIISQRQKDAADVFEAALDFSSGCVISGTYSNKGKID